MSNKKKKHKKQIKHKKPKVSTEIRDELFPKQTDPMDKGRLFLEWP